MLVKGVPAIALSQSVYSIIYVNIKNKILGKG